MNIGLAIHLFIIEPYLQIQGIYGWEQFCRCLQQVKAPRSTSSLLSATSGVEAALQSERGFSLAHSHIPYVLTVRRHHVDPQTPN